MYVCMYVCMYLISGFLVKLLKNLQAEAVRLRTISTELTQEVKEKMRAEDFCVNEGQWATKKLLELLRRSHGWAHILKTKSSLYFSCCFCKNK